MRRSSRQRIEPRSDSRRTANGTGRTPTQHLVAIPDGGGRLAEGLLVEGSLVARLLGVRLLAIDARLVVAPARLKALPGAGPGMPRARPHAVGVKLVAAERLLDAE
jgi:hypothetical protein